jgi:23S rRNA (cytidine1920-2'-O)/16S rRNA (cytidine1409-2'-O)-methyltransferase
MARPRLDQILVERGLAPSRTRAQALIMAGRVRSAGVRLEKPGSRLDPDIPLSVDPGERYVSRGGLKLEGALAMFHGGVAGLTALDVGASTGGFTQVLLEAGAERVIALDVGRGQLDWSLRTDPRVTVIEGFNARYMNRPDLPFAPDIAVIDVSFISLTLILPAVFRCLPAGGQVVALVKPQFEAGRRKVGKGGIVRDPAVHREVLHRIAGFAAENRWGIRSVAVSSIRGAEGNVEFFIGLTADPEGLDRTELDSMINRLTSDQEGASG